jgi:AcrR family transcriptional regulator
MNRQRHEELLSVAARLFREKGFRATTMDDISAEMRLTKAALYYYIESKHDLLYEICDSAISGLMQGVREIAGKDLPPLDKLRELMRWHLNMFSRYGDFINVYLADEVELEEEKRRHMRSLSREFEKAYREVVRQAVERGEFRSLDVPMTVRAIAGMCNWLSVWYRPDGEMSADDIADVFYDLITKGCLKRGGGKR